MVSLVSQERFDRWRDGAVSIACSIGAHHGATAGAGAMKALSKPLGELDA
jgi:hypothetical protein